MLYHLCPRCRKMIPVGEAYCPACTDAIRAANEARQKKKGWKSARPRAPRDPKYAQFYNSAAWRTLSRATMIDRGYLCEECKRSYITTIAAEVHHKVPIQTPEGWERRLDPTNLICLCVRCHNKAHGRWMRQSDPGEHEKV